MIIEKSKIYKILVRVPNWIGDVVMSMPALEGLRSNFPSARLTVVAKPWVIDLLDANPSVDEIVAYDTKSGPLAGPRSILAMAKRIREANYDMAVLFQNAFEAALLVWLGKVRHRVGYSTDGRAILLTHAIPRPKTGYRSRHQVDYYINLLRSIGLKIASRDPRLFLSEELKDRARQFMSRHEFDPDRITVGLAPGAMYGEAKRWPAARFAQVADLAVDRWNANILIFGSEKEKHIGEAVQKAMRHPSIDLSGKTSLGQAIELVSICSFFVTNDSGLMHISAALGVPTLAIFGSTDPTATGPRGPKTRIIYHEVDCAPCLRPTCSKDFRCMLSIEPDEVWRELKKLRAEVAR